MKHLFQWIMVVMIGLLGHSATGWADTAYIVDGIKVALRYGPANAQQ